MRGEQSQITRPYRPRIPSRFNYSSPAPTRRYRQEIRSRTPKDAWTHGQHQTGQVLGLFLYVPIYEDVRLTDPAQREMNKNNDNNVHW